ncbi:MAG: YkgJ family cysteine cluster protein [Promethearchaeia archaeon]
MTTIKGSLYTEIRKKVLQLQKEAKFECLQCQKTCCSRNIERIPLLKGDYQLLLHSNIDLNGIRSYETGQSHLLRAKGKRHCFYYDPEKGLCTIHEIKPLYCLAFPFNFQLVKLTFQGKLVNGLHSIYFPNPYCTWVKEKCKKANINLELVTQIRNLIQKYSIKE